MQELLHFAILTLKISILATVFALGLQTDRNEALFLFRRPALLLRSLLARYLVLPLAAVILIRLFDIHPAVRIAIAVLAVTPVPPSLKVPNNANESVASYVKGLLVSHTLLAIVLVPLAFRAVGSMLGVDVDFGMLAVAKTLIPSILIPLVAGMVIRYLAGPRASAFGEAIAKVAGLLLIAGILPLLGLVWKSIEVFAGNGALVALALLVIVGLAAGHFFGGPDREHRTLLARATAAHHPGLAVMIASANFPDQRQLVAGAVLTYVILALILSIPYTRWRSRPPEASLDGTRAAATSA